MVAEIVVYRSKIGPQILDLATAKLDVVETEMLANLLTVLFGQGKHIRRYINTDYSATRADDLCGDIANLACSTPQVENAFSYPEILRRIPAAVVFFDNLLRQDGEITRIIDDRQQRADSACLAPAAYRSWTICSRLMGCVIGAPSVFE